MCVCAGRVWERGVNTSQASHWVPYKEEGHLLSQGQSCFPTHFLMPAKVALPHSTEAAKTGLEQNSAGIQDLTSFPSPPLPFGWRMKLMDSSDRPESWSEFLEPRPQQSPNEHPCRPCNVPAQGRCMGAELEMTECQHQLKDSLHCWSGSCGFAESSQGGLHGLLASQWASGE